MAVPIMEKKNIKAMQFDAKKATRNVGLTGKKSQVLAGCDVSGSTAGLFSQGIIEGLFSRVLALGLTLDDNGTVPVIALDTDARVLQNELTEHNLDGYVRNYLQPLVGGGTNYAPTIEKVLDITAPGDPALVLIFTDGENVDHKEAEAAMRAASSYPIFFQFFGVYAGGGAPRFRFLEELDNLSGRVIDNAGFSKLNLSMITDDELYSAMLVEYPKFLKQAEAQGMLPWNPANDPRQRGRGGFANAANAASNLGGRLGGFFSRKP